MKSDQAKKIGAKIQAARAKLLSSTEGLEGEAWEWSPGDGQWSVRLTLVHVGASQRNHLEAARRAVAGQPVDILGFDLDHWNETHVAERADWPLDQVLAELESAQQATLDYLETLDSEQLTIRGNHPALGETSVGQVLRVIGLHDGMHRLDILRLREAMATQ